MTSAIIAALCATVGFAAGDVFTAILAKRVNGKASMFLLTSIKLLLYIPLMLLWRSEYSQVDGEALLWILLLGFLFTAAYLGFNYGFEKGNPALVGVVAGCFPASASFVAIVFLGQRPTLATILLLLTVLAGVFLIGLPEQWRKSLKFDKGVLLALIPLLGWGIFGAFLHEPVQRIGTPHAWFIVQSLVAVTMFLGVSILFNKTIPDIVAATWRKNAIKFAIIAGIIIGVAEAFQAFSLSSGKELVIIETVLGSYPAVYFLIAHRIFREPLIRRQWVGIGMVVIAVLLISGSATSA